MVAITVMPGVAVVVVVASSSSSAGIVVVVGVVCRVGGSSGLGIVASGIVEVQRAGVLLHVGVTTCRGAAS